MAIKQLICYIRIFDGCGVELEFEYVQHFPSVDEATSHSTDFDWLVVEDNLYCEKCRGAYGFDCQSCCDNLVKVDGERCQPCQEEERREIK